MSKWFALFGALRKGAILTNPAGWKTNQVVITAVLGILTVGYQFAVGFGWLPEGISEDLIANLAQAIGAAIFTVYTLYTVVATTDKIGLPPKPGGDSGGDPDAGSVRPPEGPDRAGGLSPDTGRRARGNPDDGEDRGPFFDT